MNIDLNHRPQYGNYFETSRNEILFSLVDYLFTGPRLLWLIPLTLKLVSFDDL